MNAAELEVIEHVDLGTAAEFLAYLRLANDHWGQGMHVSWIFRGQGNDEWPLLAKAWRPSTLENEFSELCRVCQPYARHQAERLLAKELKLSGWWGKVYDSPMDRIADVLLQLALEYGALSDFLEMGDELGFPVGETGFYPTAFEYLSGESLNPGADVWPSYVCRREAGLAQHHGIPTRLLDWTRKPQIAAYFAASGATGERLSVWALNLSALDPVWPRHHHDSGVGVLTCPRYNHTFLHAQDALFTWIVGADRHYLTDGSWPSLEAYLAGTGGPFENPPLRKVTLPCEEADVLTELLWRERVSRAHLMPTYDNIAAALAVKWRLQIAQIETALSEGQDADSSCSN